MSIPSQAELLAEISQLKSYTSLYRNGYLPEEVIAAAVFRSSSTSGNNNNATQSEIAVVSETTVMVTTSDTLLLVANASRKDALIINNSNSDVFISRGLTAVINRGILLRANGGFYEINLLNLYKGKISAIATSGAVSLMVSEGT